MKLLTDEEILALLEPQQVTPEQGFKAFAKLKALNFIGGRQANAVRELMRGEEGQFFQEKMVELLETVEKMPATYETREMQTDEKTVWLHYFTGGAASHYIVEKDKGSPGDKPEEAQSQAYGYADLGDPMCAEWGYVSLPEILSCNGELDFHFRPRTVAELKLEGKIHE